MTFADDLRRFAMKAERTTHTVFVNSASHVYESITVGSPVTAAPGQPVGQYGPGYHEGEVGGDLRASWQLQFTSPTTALVSTNSAHAESNEDGIARPGGGPYIQRSTVGGRHSVKLTRAGWSRIVDAEAAKAGGTR